MLHLLSYSIQYFLSSIMLGYYCFVQQGRVKELISFYHTSYFTGPLRIIAGGPVCELLLQLTNILPTVIGVPSLMKGSVIDLRRIHNLVGPIDQGLINNLLVVQ